MNTSPVRWWDTLFFRGALIVNSLVVGAFVGLAMLHHRADRERAVNTVQARLSEDAHVLRVARTRIPSRLDFQRFVDDYCHQMGSTASPGHHIIVVGADGSVIARAHDRANVALEAAMIAHVNGSKPEFEVHDEPFLASDVRLPDGERIAVAQSMANVQGAIAATRNRTVIITLLLVSAVFAGSTLAFRRWVRRPLADLCGSVASIGARDFEARAPIRGPGEIRFLAGSVNDMAGQLQAFDRSHRAAMQRARDIQRSLLPEHLPDSQLLEFAHFFQPAESIGGDLFDVIALGDGRIMVALFDVSGHGTPAALNTALLRTVLRHCVRSEMESLAIVHEMNRELVAIGDGSEFATCLLLCIESNGDEFSIISAGHDCPVILRSVGRVEHLVGGDLPLGVFESTRYEEQRACLTAGDRVLLFTDGIHEVFDGDGKMLGRSGLQHLIEATADATLQDQVASIVNQVTAFQHSTSFSDDVTLLAIERK